MKLLPGSPLSAFVEAVELDGVTISATYVDLETGHVQHWVNGAQVEAQGEVKILLKSKIEPVSLNPSMSTTLDRLLEETKRQMARMSPEDRAKEYELQRQSFARAMNTPCEHGMVDFEQCEKCRAPLKEVK